MVIDDKKDFHKFNHKGDAEINLLDCYEVYYLSMKNNLSISCSDELIQSFYNRSAIRHFGEAIEIPTYKTIKNVIEKDLSNLIPLYKFTYHLPTELFGTKYKVMVILLLKHMFKSTFSICDCNFLLLKGKTLEPAVGFYFDFRRKICQICLDINPNDLVTSYIDICDRDMKNLLIRAYNGSDNVSIGLFQHIKAFQNKEFNLRKFHIRATSIYAFKAGSIQQCQAYSFIKINFEDNLDDTNARVMAIIQLKSETKCEECLIVALLKSSKQKDKYYPYPVYQYLTKNGLLELAVITLKSIVAPVFGISLVSKSCFHRETITRGFNNESFYLIDTSRIRNNGTNLSYNILNKTYPDVFLSHSKLVKYSEILAEFEACTLEVDDSDTSSNED